MPNEPKSFPSVILRSSTVFTHSVCFSRFCVLLGSKGPERTERLAFETSEEANNGIKGHLGMNSTIWYQEDFREAALATDALRSPRICSRWTCSHGVVCLMCVFLETVMAKSGATRPAPAQKGSRPDAKCSCLDVVCGQALAGADWIKLDCF